MEKINHPLHYGGDVPYEHVKVVEDWRLGYHLGNATKYMCRAGRKRGHDSTEELQKAAWYLRKQAELMGAGYDFGLASPIRTLDPSDVCVAWQLSLNLALAVMKIGYAYTVDDVGLMKEALFYVEQEIRALLAGLKEEPDE